MRLPRRVFLTVAGAAITSAASGTKCDPLEKLVREGTIVNPDSNPRKNIEDGRGMKPRELRDQILGAPLTNTEFDYPKTRRGPER